MLFFFSRLKLLRIESVNLSFVETPLMNGMKVSGSVGGLVDFYKVEYKGTPISFKADNEYKVKLKLHGKRCWPAG